jgi:thiamine biosynthesis protein ThiI
MGLIVDRVVLVRVGELSVKRGWTRKEMERLLLNAMKEAAEECGGAKFAWEPGRFYAWGDVDCLKRVLSRVFGVKSVSPTYLIRFSNLDVVAEAAARLWGDDGAGPEVRSKGP